jgi:hypothetical protein
MTLHEIRKAALRSNPSASKARIRNNEVHVFGPMPNTNQEGWYFVGWMEEIQKNIQKTGEANRR